MNKKEIIVPFIVFGLTAIFAGICLAVFLTNGKSKKWIARKMKIGGLLLSLTAVACNNGNEEVMCYDTVQTNSMWMHANSANGIELMLDTNNVLTGTVYEYFESNLSFAVIDHAKNKIQTGDLIPLDGKLDQYEENFKIELDKNLKAGDYSLNLYVTDVNGQDSIQAQNFIKLIIKDE